MHATVSCIIGGSTMMPCFQSTTSRARDSCTEAARPTHSAVVKSDPPHSQHVQKTACVLSEKAGVKTAPIIL